MKTANVWPSEDKAIVSWAQHGDVYSLKVQAGLLNRRLPQGVFSFKMLKNPF